MCCCTAALGTEAGFNPDFNHFKFEIDSFHGQTELKIGILKVPGGMFNTNQHRSEASLIVSQ